MMQEKRVCFIIIKSEEDLTINAIKELDIPTKQEEGRIVLHLTKEDLLTLIQAIE